MYYANLSANAHVTSEGINYYLVTNELDGIAYEHIQIPFIGFNSADFSELDNGNILVLSSFDLRVKNGKLILRKGVATKNHILVLYSIPWNDDGYIGSLTHGKSPEAVFKLKAGAIFDRGFYHEYLFVLRKGIQYEFGYISESTKNYFLILLRCDLGSDTLVSKIYRPLDFDF